MKIHLEILDDNNEILADHIADASCPSSWNAPQGQKFVSKMPQNSDNANTGTYELFRITVQPHLRVDRPNGYVAPVPSPSGLGLPPGFPTNIPTKPLYQKQPGPWGMPSPTQAPQAASSLGTPPTRG